jgi:hypothetical protein
MKIHAWMPHVLIQPRYFFTAEGSPSAVRTDPMVRTAHGIAILAIALGGFGAGGAAALGHGDASHVKANHSAHSTRTGRGRHAALEGTSGAWMW